MSQDLRILPLRDGQLVRLGVTPSSVGLSASYSFTGLVTDDPSAGAANSLAIKTQMASRGGIGRIPAGAYYVDTYVNPTNSGYTAAIQIPTLKGIVGDGVDATFLLLGAGPRATVTDVVTNARPGGGDTGMWVGNLTVDGRAASQTVFNHGVSWRRATNSHRRAVNVKDWRGGRAGGNTEMFGLEDWHGSGNTDKFCKGYSTLGPGGPISSAFSANYSDRHAWEDCEADDMGLLMGFTAYKATNLRRTRCVARRNGAQGFNDEYSDYVLNEDCLADGNKGTGGLSNRSSHTTWANFTATNNGTAGSLGKESGFEVIADSTNPVVDVQLLNSTVKGNVKGVTLLAGGTDLLAQVLIGPDVAISGNTSANSNGGAATAPRDALVYSPILIPDWPL